jgi:hypothetical protein
MEMARGTFIVPAPMRRFIYIFLGGFWLDAVLSVCDAWLPLTPLRNLVALAELLLGLGVFASMAFMPRLPKRLLLPPIAFLIWTNICGGFPLAFVIPELLDPILSWAQLALALVLLLIHLRGREWQAERISGFSWKNFALFAIVTILLAPIVLVIAVANAAGMHLEATTNGYVKIRPGGLILEERTFEKNDRKVRLVSMMHVGQKQFYEDIHASLQSGSPSAVLMEGVSDEQGLLKGFSYARIAKMLGLSAQESSALQQEGKQGGSGEGPRKVDYRHADVDVSSFSPLTIEFINAIGVLLASPTINAAMEALNAPVFDRPDAETAVYADILDKRNVHLKAQIDDALREHGTVVVPWGAMHLPYIEDALREDGFQETRRVARPVIQFWSPKTAAPEPSGETH